MLDSPSLHVGCPVVHLEHGRGRFEGLTTIDTGSEPQEFVTLSYADEARLHVPVDAMHRMTLAGADGAGDATLDALGSARWASMRERLDQDIGEVAERLMHSLRQRNLRERPPHAIDHAAYRAFAEGFDHETTPDQDRAIEAVLADLSSDRPMDRIVCGDVGFGKTEIAVRAAWAVAHAGRQVIMLVPTTLLLNQHVSRLQARFADTALRVGALSRLSSSAEQRRTVEQLSSGQLDIVIGTHRLLGDDVDFADLGLVIIDEEHRFGLEHKQQVAQLRASADILTLTATPIPRTLDASLAGLRDVSMLRTPPVHRQPVTTRVVERSDDVIRDACRTELARDGQILFLHNEIESQPALVEHLKQLVPEARVQAAHGQLDDEVLSERMEHFRAGGFDILVATTIIENGIDLPNANTLLVDSPERFGLAQLHQLRGRVGRAERSGVAILLTTPDAPLDDDAQRRLDALQRFDQLGAGFELAARDLDMRGAGELLGDAQSGHVGTIGHAMYARLLARHARAREHSRGGPPTIIDADVDLGVTAALPGDYVTDDADRLQVYIEISAAQSPCELEQLRKRLVTDAGPLPLQGTSLFETARLRLRCERVGVSRLHLSDAGGDCCLAPNVVIDRTTVEGIGADADVVLEQTDDRVSVVGFLHELDERIALADRLLDALGDLS